MACRPSADRRRSTRNQSLRQGKPVSVSKLKRSKDTAKRSPHSARTTPFNSLKRCTGACASVCQATVGQFKSTVAACGWPCSRLTHACKAPVPSTCVTTCGASGQTASKDNHGCVLTTGAIACTVPSQWAQGGASGVSSVLVQLACKRTASPQAAGGLMSKRALCVLPCRRKTACTPVNSTVAWPWCSLVHSTRPSRSASSVCASTQRAPPESLSPLGLTSKPAAHQRPSVLRRTCTTGASTTTCSKPFCHKDMKLRLACKRCSSKAVLPCSSRQRTSRAIQTGERHQPRPSASKAPISTGRPNAVEAKL